MIVTVWHSGENLQLATAELAAAAQRLGGRIVEAVDPALEPGCSLAELPDRAAAVALAGRLALARRCAERWDEADEESILTRLRLTGSRGKTAAFQWVPGSSGTRPTEVLRRLGNAYRWGGGRIALDRPELRFWLRPTLDGRFRIYEQVGVVDRSSFSHRGASRMPFQRPVTLSPKLARVLVNLAGVGPGDRVVDPFVGTGSLLLETAMLGAETVGIDSSAAMIRGALANFAHAGRTPGVLRQADAEEAAKEFPPASFDALVTDPPYGRASGTHGERPDRLWGRVLPAWLDKVRPGGRFAVVLPTGAPVPALEAQLELAIPQRVHRSLTREFRVYVAAGRPDPA